MTQQEIALYYRRLHQLGVWCLMNLIVCFSLGVIVAIYSREYWFWYVLYVGVSCIMNLIHGMLNCLDEDRFKVGILNGVSLILFFYSVILYWWF